MTMTAAQLDAPWLAQAERKKRAARLHHPVDAMVTFRWSTNTLGVAFAAIDAGLQLGTRSTAVAMQTRNGRTRLPWVQRLPISFVDNEYHGYDHGLHVSVVALLSPKYATVRDYMTPRQCEAAGIEYYSLDQILTWAEELEKYAEHVIVIPKADVMHEIPERYVIGYSVQSSYGGTPLPTETFRGRAVHLLGGSWKDQRAIMDDLGDDVVAIDFNQMFKNALYGTATLRDGTQTNLREVVWTDGHVNEEPANSWYACLVLSMGFISAALHDEYLPRSARSIPRVGTSKKVFVPWYRLEEEV